MRRRIMPVLVLALVAVALFGGAAYGEEPIVYTQPGECYTCHGVSGTGAVGKVDFDVPAVDYAKCATCHAGVSNLQHWHNVNLSRCTGCHLTTVPLITDTSKRFTSTFVSPDYGVFKTSASLSSSPQALHAAHSGTGWVNSLVFKAGSAADCANCHRAASCSACHADSVAHTDHAVSDYPAVSYEQSTGTGTTTAPSTCVNTACHDLAKAASAEFVPWCGTCHPARVDEHGYDTIDHVADDGDIEGMACSACHSLDLATVHGDPGAEGASCATCHPQPRTTFDAWDQTCATGGCHTVSSTRPMHAGIDASHAVSETNTLCLDCHTGTELGSIHAGATDETAGTTSCFVCHTGEAGQPSTNDCTTCHFTFEEHYGAERHTSSWAPLTACSGAECHSASGDLMTVHVEKDASFTCAGCHSSFRVAGQIERHLTGCGDCHDGVTQSSGHRDVHGADPSLETTTHVPNYAYYTGSVGTPKTTDCTGCHTSNLVDEHIGLYYLNSWIVAPRFDSTGAALTCASCHSSADSTVVSAIEAGLSSCESCHDVHGPIAAVHSVTFDTSAGVDCAGCHSSQLETEHNGTYTTTTPSGRVLAGCAVCHSYWESERGALIESAISAEGQTQCSVCHGTQHPDLGGHTATSPDSQACAVCHDKGGAADIDVQAVHADAVSGACAVCHSNADRVAGIADLTAECSSCHAVEGSTYHRGLPAAHTYDAMDSSCTGAGCHTANTLPEEHERFLAGSGYTTTCALCHDNADPARIDWSTATAACETCHTVHGDIAQIHTAQTTETCFGCHKSNDAMALHIEEATGETDCAACHNASTTLPKPLTCGGCHATEGSDYHAGLPAAHTYDEMDASCTGTGCHAANTLPEEHERFLARYPGYDTTCELCHENVDAGRIDWSTATAACDTCHSVHGDIDVIHTAAASQGCVDCHETGDALALHVTGSGVTDCALCHAAPSGRIDWTTATIECGSCHGALQPVELRHYPLAAHATVTERGCRNCHSMDLKTEHLKSTVAVGCVECHETYVDSFTAPWDQTCDACHPTRHKHRTGGGRR